jgi:hypothetical protein
MLSGSNPSRTASRGRGGGGALAKGLPGLAEAACNNAFRQGCDLPLGADEFAEALAGLGYTAARHSRSHDKLRAALDEDPAALLLWLETPGAISPRSAIASGTACGNGRPRRRLGVTFPLWGSRKALHDVQCKLAPSRV